MAPQARFWLLTIPKDAWNPPSELPEPCTYVKGQAETGATTGYEHWQVIAGFKRAVRLSAVKAVFSSRCHAEPSRSAAADDYVWKDDTAIEGSRFELGGKPLRRNNKVDWDTIRAKAVSGEIDDIPADVYIRYYNQLTRIRQDNLRPVAIERRCKVFWGRTGLGKSHTAWAEAGISAYPKDPRSKFWDGYRGQSHVVIDEFRGAIDVSHMLRWLDKYPVIVEVKGSSVVLKATTIWITSNLHPKDWYKDLDEETRQALLRRLEIVHFDSLHQ